MFSPDGQWILTASEDWTAKLFDAETGELVREFGRDAKGGYGPEHHSDAIWSAALSPDSKRVVTASEDETARLWDTQTGEQIAVLSGHEDAIYSASFNAEGSRIVTAAPACLRNVKPQAYWLDVPFTPTRPPAENTAEKQRVRQQMLARNWHDDAISPELGSFCQKSHFDCRLN